MADKYLVFDFGASHGRCLVAEYDGNSFKMEETHEFDNRPVNYAGILYWDILRLSSEMAIGIQKSLKRYPDIRSIGVDTWGCDFGFIDNRGKLLANPINYRDEMRYKYKPELDELMGGYEIFKLGGASIINIMGLYNMYALQRERASELAYAKRLLMIPDLLNYELIGEATNEYTDATMSLMVDQAQKTWQYELIDRLGFPRSIFADLIQPGTRIGRIQKRMCDEYNIPSIPVIAVASHDTASAIAGVPLQSKDRDWAYLSFGTWAIMGVETDLIYTDRKTFESGFGNQGGCEGKNNLNNCVTGLWVIQQCYEKWKNDDTGIERWDDVVYMASRAKGGIAFIDLDALEFAQPNPNMPKAVVEYCRKRGHNLPENAGEIARCVYESLVLKMKSCFEDMQEITNKQYTLMHIFGGGAKNKLLCQWIADALGIPIKAGPAETTSVGNLLMQMKGTGEISSLAEGREISARSFTLTEYEPKDQKVWAEYYMRYSKEIRKQ